MARKGISFIIAVVFILVSSFCYGQANNSELKEEVALVNKAGRDELTLGDREELKRQNHPILMQIGDPATKRLLSLFAGLPSSTQSELLEKGWLKWRYTELDKERQQVFRDIVQLNIDMAVKQGLASNPNFSIEALVTTDVGFVVIDIPESNQKVISWFILWPATTLPTWITVVGAKAVGTQAYFAAHMKQLPLLKGMPYNKLPSSK